MTARRAIEHATDRGYRAHLRRGQRACIACVDAHNTYEWARAHSYVKPLRELLPCGTSATWKRHKRRDEEPCPACVAARRAEDASYSRQRRWAA